MVAWATPADERQRLDQEIADLEAQLADLQARTPAHSMSPVMMLALDDLEERLADLRQRRAELARDARQE
jgi:hypothetical protein